MSIADAIVDFTNEYLFRKRGMQLFLVQKGG